MAVTQPAALKRAAVTTPFSTRAERRKTSPQAGFSSSTVAVAPASSPAFRGFLKWSSTCALYMGSAEGPLTMSF